MKFTPKQAKDYLFSKVESMAEAFSVLFVVTALLVQSFMPLVVRADTSKQIVPVFVPRAVFPVSPDRDPVERVTVVATAYNSLVWQTDSTPNITASGTRTRHGVIATNFLPIGTNVRFPDAYGSTVFVVEDRMNRRYGHGRVDIWMESYPDAKIFGAKRLTMEIY